MRNDTEVFTENKLAGIEIYLDLNNNGVLDLGEPVTITMSDNPSTPNIDEAGNYEFNNLSPGTYAVRQISLAGFAQTSPSSVSYTVTVNNNSVTELNFGNDAINCGDGDDLALGGLGNDLINCGAGNDSILGSLGNDTLWDNDTLDFILNTWSQNSWLKPRRLSLPYIPDSLLIPPAVFISSRISCSLNPY